MFTPQSLKEELFTSFSETRILAVLWETLVHEFGHVAVAADGGLMPRYVEIKKPNFAVSVIKGIKTASGELEPTRLDLIARVAVAGVGAESLLSADDEDRGEIVKRLGRYRYRGDLRMLENALGSALAGAEVKVIGYINEAIDVLRPRMVGIAEAALDAAERHAAEPRAMPYFVSAPILYRVVEPDR